MKHGDALSPLLFNFSLEYAIRKDRVNQDGLKVNGTRQLLVYADDANMLGGSVHTIKKNKEALIGKRVVPKISGLTYKSRAKWKMLRGIYSAIYGEVNVSVSVCVEIKGDCIEK